MSEGSDRQKWEERTKNSHERVVEALDRKANNDGWKTVEKHSGPEQGIDLKLEKDNRLVITEVAGERPAQPNVTGRVKMALGAIMMDMNNEEAGREYRYCIAFPATEAFERCKIPVQARKFLGINVIFVKCATGALKVLLPDANNVTDLSNLDGLFSC
jgi:hypothetical protein